ncbi:MAG: hypothetical protein CMI13_12585 [Oleibacter sp.]|nr:hypothetical protein [Thalassolituus sp.]
MAIQVTMGATLQCSQGIAPSSLIVPPVNRTLADGMPAATIMDQIPIVNIPPFGMCRSMANPTVAAATAAAMGTLTPMPCVPVIAAPWSPGAKTVMIGNKPALNNSAKCQCNWGGSISITNPGGKTVQTP